MDSPDEAKRDALLHAIGFPSFADYLNSATWRRIASAAIGRNSGSCFVCGRKAETARQLHYSKHTLMGKSSRGVIAVCFNCLRRIDANDGGLRDVLTQAARLIGPNRHSPPKKGKRYKNARYRGRGRNSCGSNR